MNKHKIKLIELLRRDGTWTLDRWGHYHKQAEVWFRDGRKEQREHRLKMKQVGWRLEMRTAQNLWAPIRHGYYKDLQPNADGQVVIGRLVIGPRASAAQETAGLNAFKGCE